MCVCARVCMCACARARVCAYRFAFLCASECVYLCVVVSVSAERSMLLLLCCASMHREVIRRGSVNWSAWRLRRE